ncbi:MAG: alpha/beta hydrolase [Massilia sp.]|nr:alpha/beta hydrolase [Massilia sp.]
MTLVLSLLAVAALLVLLLFLFTVYMVRKVESVLPPRGRFIDVPGARLHLREFDGGAAEAPALLLVHGLAGQLAHYTYGVTDRLAGRWRMVAVDRPGNGHSTRAPDTPADLKTQADALAALIDALGLERPLVVGHSLGGALALALALHHPQRVGGLALIAPLTHMQDAVPPVFEGLTIQSPGWRRFVAWTLAIPASIRNSRATLEQVFGPDPVPHDFATRGGGLLGLRPGAFLSASADLQALPERLPDQQMRYGELRMPVSILYGKDDRILDWQAHGQALADKVDGARLELVAGGHMLPVTHPDVTAAFIDAAAADCHAQGRAAVAPG